MGGVIVEVGPVASSSALAFVGYGEAVLADPLGPGAGLPEDVREAFSGYLDEWRALAAAGPELTWSAETTLETAEYLVHAFYRIAQQLEERAVAVGRQAPDAAEPFYRRLVVGLLDAIAREGSAGAAFAEHLREFWPGGLEA